MNETTAENGPVRLVLNWQNLRHPEIGAAELLVWLTRHDGQAMTVQERTSLCACATRAMSGDVKPFGRALVLEAAVQRRNCRLQLRLAHEDVVMGNERCHWFFERFDREVTAAGMRLVQPAETV